MQCIKQKMGMPGLGEGKGLGRDLGVGGAGWPDIWAHLDWLEAKGMALHAQVSGQYARTAVAATAAT